MPSLVFLYIDVDLPNRSFRHLNDGALRRWHFGWSKGVFLPTLVFGAYTLYRPLPWMQVTGRPCVVVEFGSEHCPLAPVSLFSRACRVALTLPASFEYCPAAHPCNMDTPFSLVFTYTLLYSFRVTAIQVVERCLCWATDASPIHSLTLALQGLVFPLLSLKHRWHVSVRGSRVPQLMYLPQKPFPRPLPLLHS